MKILLTGANGYIGTRLLLALAQDSHTVVAMVRSRSRLNIPSHLKSNVILIEGDLLRKETLKAIPKDIDAAYYLVHSMGQLATGFTDLEALCAKNFIDTLSQTEAKQIIYLSGLSKKTPTSEHMQSRHNVERLLQQGAIPVTVLQAGIIIGSGSASFEIMRDLVEKLPIMIGPKWVSSLCQPIAITDVIYYLKGVLGKKECFATTFEIGGPDVLSYREMLLSFARIRHLKRWIIPIPLLTPYLSSLWLFFVTSANFSIARALVRSLTTDAICTHSRIKDILPRKCLTFEEAIRRAFEKVEQNAVVSSWKDAMNLSELNPHLSPYLEVPSHGCIKKIHSQTAPIPQKKVIDKLWAIGGDHGWYYMDWAWTLRGGIDRLMGGVGVRRGRTHPTELRPGDALDFWRVIIADKAEGHLLLYAEMILPGEAWLEWKTKEKSDQTTVTQIATFRPKGVLGRLYWYSLIPMHAFIFRGLLSALFK